MFPVILQFLMAKFNTLSYIDKVFGLGATTKVQGEKIAAVYVEDELVPIDYDQYKSLVYILADGAIERITEEHPLVSNAEIVTETYPLRAIIYVQNAEAFNCESYSQSVAQGIKKNLSGVQDDIRSATNADLVTVKIKSTELDSGKVWESQFSIDNKLKDNDILIAIDFEVTIKGDEQCFAGEPCTASEFVFDYSAQSFCSMVNQCSGIGKTPVFFYTEAGKTDYTSTDVPGLAKLSTSSELIAVNMDRGNLEPTFRAWEDSTFKIKQIDVAGGEYIVIFWK